MKKSILWTGLLSLIFTHAYASQPLPPEIVKLMKQPQYASSTWTLYVKDLTDNKVQYDLNGSRFFSPGSVSKLFTVAALLNTFGPKTTIQTPVYALGKVSDNGVFTGNLILVGKGDLTLGASALPGNKIANTNAERVETDEQAAELTQQDPLAGLKSLAQQIRQNGIKTIVGNVIIDNRYFRPYIQNGIKFSPIFINENLLDFVISPTSVDSPATVTFRPQIPGIEVINKVMTVLPTQASHITFKRNHDGSVIEAEGTIGAGAKTIVHTFPIQNPEQFAHNAFVQALEEEGVTVRENPDEDFEWPDLSVYQTMQPVAVLHSPEMLEFAKLILKVSHDIGANLIPALLAASHGKTTYADGTLLLGQFLSSVARVDPAQIVFGGDAAGGGGNRMTGVAVMQLLEYFYHLPGDQFQSILYTLPILGEDGSLALVAQNTAAKGHVFAKTGSGVVFNKLNDTVFITTKGLAGFYQGKDKHWRAFVIVLNNAPIGRGTDIFTVNNDLGLIAAALYEKDQADLNTQAPAQNESQGLY